MSKINCSYCGSEFNRKPSEIKEKNNFCCRDCYNKALIDDKKLNGNYKGGKYIKCDYCDKEIYKRPSCVFEHNFCSRRCFGKWESENKTGESACNYKNALLTKICPVCNKEFTTYFSNQVCCSVKCKSIVQNNRETLKCVNCNTVFERTASEIFWANQRGCENIFCSTKCKQEYHVGENHPNWIKDRTQLKNQNKSMRWSKEMCDWRKSIYKRDNYTCQMCGNRSHKDNAVILNAHHIKRFIDNENLRFDIDNGITLCEDCHKLTYGKENDFEKQFKNTINFIKTKLV